MMKTPNALIFILCVFLLDLYQCLHLDCPHDKMDLKLDIDDNDEDPFDGRLLQSEYANIRIYADYSHTNIEPDVQDYIKNQLMPPVINYYQQTLQVIPRAKKLTYKKDTICGLPTPQIFMNEGVDADIAFIIDASFEDTSYIAYARACSIQNGDKRPTFGNAHFNLKYVKLGGEKTHDQNLLVALHEMAHVFGISKGLFEYYFNPETGTTREGHIITRDLNGMTSYFIDVEPLTSKLREFYNCPVLEGALLENEGESMSASHLERRVFYSELMTAGEMEEARISEFMLAFLEGTGWYKGNYSMTEPVFWGKGKGCDFYYSPCVDRRTFTPSYEEFCPSLTEAGCSVTRRTGASCGASAEKTDSSLLNPFDYWGNNSVVGDMFADNCPYFVPNSNKDCEDPIHQNTALLQEESYGGGSKCFSGTLIYSWQRLNKKTNYCFKSSCELQPDGRYFLSVTIGSASVTCMTSGSLDVPGFQGQIDCPDPSVYCSTYGKPFCSRGCMGKGQCINDICVCDEGWGGDSCGMKVYAHGCQRCINDATQTSCFGDTCVCNPLDPACSYKPVVSDMDLVNLVNSDDGVGTNSEESPAGQNNNNGDGTGDPNTTTSQSSNGGSTINNSGTTNNNNGGKNNNGSQNGSSGTNGGTKGNSHHSQNSNNGASNGDYDEPTEDEARSIGNNESIQFLRPALYAVFVIFLLY